MLWICFILLTALTPATHGNTQSECMQGMNRYLGLTGTEETIMHVCHISSISLFLDIFSPFYIGVYAGMHHFEGSTFHLANVWDKSCGCQTRVSNYYRVVISPFTVYTIPVNWIAHLVIFESHVIGLSDKEVGGTLEHASNNTRLNATSLPQVFSEMYRYKIVYCFHLYLMLMLRCGMALLCDVDVTHQSVMLICDVDVRIMVTVPHPHRTHQHQTWTSALISLLRIFTEIALHAMSFSTTTLDAAVEEPTANHMIDIQEKDGTNLSMTCIVYHNFVNAAMYTLLSYPL